MWRGKNISLNGLQDVEEISRKPELEVAELLQPHDQTWMDKELFVRDEQGKCHLEKESTPHEDAEETVEISTKDLDCDIN